MRRAVRQALLSGVACLLALTQAVSVQAAAVPDGGRTGGTIQQKPTPPCSQPAGSGRWAAANPHIEFEENDVGPSGTWGRPRLCVTYFPAEDVYNLMITGTDDVGQFRAAKAESVARLQARGFDLCRASKWGSWGSPNQPGYSFDDYYGMTVPCEAQVRAGDPGAIAHLGTVQSALARAIDATAEDLGYRPDAPFSVLVFTEQSAAIEAYKKYRATLENDERAEQAAVAGVSRSVQGNSNNYVYGNLILINLTDPNYVSAARIDLDVVNRYTFFALSALTGTDPNINIGVNSTVPRWFASGVYTRQSYRNAVEGTNGGYLVEAARAARAGTVPPLAILQTLDQERAGFGRFGYYVVSARTYAVTAYLYETYGTEAVSGLLRENRNGSVGHFNELLGQLTGTDAAGLDRGTTNWLLGLTPLRAASSDGQFKVEAVLYGDGHRGEAVVDEAVSACLFDVSDANAQVQNAPGLVGLSIVLGPDGTYTVSRPSSRSGNAVSLSGRLEGPGQLTAVYRVTNEVIGCDSGAIPLSPV